MARGNAKRIRCTWPFSCRGFTLTEVVIVAAIIAILTAIAVPIYQNQIVKARRADGQVALMDLAARMERYYAQNHTFATATIGSGNAATDVLPSNQSPEGHYSLSIVSQSPTTFIIEAQPTGQQATADTKCESLRINQMGQKTVTGSGNASDCW